MYTNLVEKLIAFRCKQTVNFWWTGWRMTLKWRWSGLRATANLTTIFIDIFVEIFAQRNFFFTWTLEYSNAIYSRTKTKICTALGLFIIEQTHCYGNNDEIIVYKCNVVASNHSFLCMQKNDDDGVTSNTHCGSKNIFMGKRYFHMRRDIYDFNKIIIKDRI